MASLVYGKWLLSDMRVWVSADDREAAITDAAATVESTMAEGHSFLRDTLEQTGWEWRGPLITFCVCVLWSWVVWFAQDQVVFDNVAAANKSLESVSITHRLSWLEIPSASAMSGPSRKSYF